VTAFLTQQSMWSNSLTRSSNRRPVRALLVDVGWIHGATWCLYVGLLVRYWRRPLGDALFWRALLISTQQEVFQGIYRHVVPLCR
jgi:hypothetical protein